MGSKQNAPARIRPAKLAWPVGGEPKGEKDIAGYPREGAIRVKMDVPCQISRPAGMRLDAHQALHSPHGAAGTQKLALEQVVIRADAIWGAGQKAGSPFFTPLAKCAICWVVG